MTDRTPQMLARAAGLFAKTGRLLIVAFALAFAIGSWHVAPTIDCSGIECQVSHSSTPAGQSGGSLFAIFESGLLAEEVLGDIDDAPPSLSVSVAEIVAHPQLRAPSAPPDGAGNRDGLLPDKTGPPRA